LEENGIDSSDVEDIDLSDLEDGIIIIEANDTTVADDIEEKLEEEDIVIDGK